MWNSYKIRIIIMGAFRPDDATLVFRLLHIFYNDKLDIDTLRMLKTKKKIIDFFKAYE